MTNLLPPTAKKQIIAEYWTRVVCAWVMLWSVCMFVGVLLLWPTYVLLTGSNEAYAESASAAIERTNEYEELSDVLEQASTQAKEIVVTVDRPLMSDITTAVFSTAEPGVTKITDLRVSREKGDLLPLSISGEAADRLALARLRDALVALPFVTSVDLPIDNLAKNEDISFSLTVIVNNEAL